MPQNKKAQEIAAQSGGAVKSASEPPPQSAKEKPIHEIRIGKIKAIVWANYTENGVRQ